MIAKNFKLTPKKGYHRDPEPTTTPSTRKQPRNGHFGRELPNFTWERTDKATALRREVGKEALVGS